MSIKYKMRRNRGSIGNQKKRVTRGALLTTGARSCSSFASRILSQEGENDAARIAHTEREHAC